MMQLAAGDSTPLAVASQLHYLIAPPRTGGGARRTRMGDLHDPAPAPLYVVIKPLGAGSTCPDDALMQHRF